MKNVTKTNVLFTSTVLVYIILVYVVRLIPAKALTLNMLLVLPEVILLIPSLVYIIVLRPSTVDDVRISPVSLGTFFKTVLLTFLIMPLVSFINAISSFFVGNSVNNTLDLIVGKNPLWLNLIIVALLPAVVEEFIFRGLIFNGYKRRNPFKAVILSAVLFGLVHMNINQFSYAFVIGVIFALLAYATGSLIPSITAHFLINGTSVVMAHFYAGKKDAPVASGEIKLPENAMFIITCLFLLMLAIGGVVLGTLLFISICKKNRGTENVKRIFAKPYRKMYDEGEGKFIDGYLLLGIGICLIFIVLYDFIL